MILPSIISNVQFYASSKFFPSSTKGECLAILTALIICPPNSKIDIFTDSKSAICTFTTAIQNYLLARRFNKINNYHIWVAIKHIIQSLHLSVNLTKVKAHSGNEFNDAADLLAKCGNISNKWININYKAIPINITSIWDPRNTAISLDRTIWKATKIITNYRTNFQFLSEKSLSDIHHFAKTDLIDWKYTIQWFHFNPSD
ncbi:hypothetical protein RclHR1_02580014 [Rhizophagus clarus]|uniref:Ribonuclease H-like domain-containing protein n=1 Tax=Rhizophagus clarus TaxID=94130 RepID=A0A2Z6RFB2_9GLOM|nr:hypothetical protein RclHR1_02580014 [Rhizophagus clarus]GES98124.1 ribonuclease H-like domain-containing protein [Rhizophagus clarus]